MKTFYVVTIRKGYTDIEFQFERYCTARDFVELIIENSEHEASIKKVQLPFSESEVDE